MSGHEAHENMLCVPKPGVQVEDLTGNCILPPELEGLRDAPVGKIFKWSAWDGGHWRIARIEEPPQDPALAVMHQKILWCRRFG